MPRSVGALIIGVATSKSRTGRCRCDCHEEASRCVNKCFRESSFLLLVTKTPAVTLFGWEVILMIGKLNSAWWALRVGLGLGAFLAGLDKFFNVLTDWGMYLSPLAERLLPVSGVVFMRVVGVIEMAVGLLILAGFARLGGYILMGWLVSIAINLVSTGMFFDLAVRDVEIALAAYTLARLTEVRQTAGSRESTPGGPPALHR